MLPEYNEPLTTDQKVGGSSPSGRAADRSGGSPEIPPLPPFQTKGSEPGSTPVSAHTSAHIQADEHARALILAQLERACPRCGTILPPVEPAEMTTEEWWDANPEEHRRGGRGLGMCLVVLGTILVGLAGLLVWSLLG